MTGIKTKQRILVIDDDEPVRAFARQALTRAGYEVADLPSAAKVEERVAEFQPDLLLCDWLMPGRDGLAVCQALTSSPDTSHIQVVVVSSKTFESDKAAARNAGACAFLEKPFSVDELLQVVHASLSSTVMVRVRGCRAWLPTPERHGGEFGGNTSCVEISLSGNRRLVLDAGSGIRSLSEELLHALPSRIALLITHFHWDHILGLPHFLPLYSAAHELTVMAPAADSLSLERRIRADLGNEYFPLSMGAVAAAVSFQAVEEGEFVCFGVPVQALYTYHPGRTVAYRVEPEGVGVVYAPDNEITPDSVWPELQGEALRFANFCRGARLLIHDATFSRDQYEERRGLGHSSPDMVAAIAAQAGVEQVLLFHHAPDSDDATVAGMCDEFASACQALGVDIAVDAAREGMTLELG